MTTVQEIESAVIRLSPEELARFRDWFEAYEAQSWDKQIEEDARSGRLDRMANEALQAFQAGQCTEL